LSPLRNGFVDDDDRVDRAIYRQLRISTHEVDGILSVDIADSTPHRENAKGTWPVPFASRGPIRRREGCDDGRQYVKPNAPMEDPSIT
jgi:hypothetical protein